MCIRDRIANDAAYAGTGGDTALERAGLYGGRCHGRACDTAYGRRFLAAYQVALERASADAGVYTCFTDKTSEVIVALSCRFVCVHVLDYASGHRAYKQTLARSRVLERRVYEIDITHGSRKVI